MRSPNSMLWIDLFKSELKESREKRETDRENRRSNKRQSAIENQKLLISQIKASRALA